MHLAIYVGLLHTAEQRFADSCRTVADGHADEPDVAEACRQFAEQADRHAGALRPVADRYGEQPDHEPDRLHVTALGGARTGPVGLLRDLHDLYALASFLDLGWTVVGQAAQGARDTDLSAVVSDCEHDVTRQLAWLKTRIKAAAPQPLVAG